MTVDDAVLEKISYRRFLKLVEMSTAFADVPTRYALRHGKLRLWPVPDAVYSVTVDYSKYHPAVFTDILFAPEFNEAGREDEIVALLDELVYLGVLRQPTAGRWQLRSRWRTVLPRWSTAGRCGNPML